MSVPVFILCYSMYLSDTVAPPAGIFVSSHENMFCSIACGAVFPTTWGPNPLLSYIHTYLQPPVAGAATAHAVAPRAELRFAEFRRAGLRRARGAVGALPPCARCDGGAAVMV